MEDVEQRDRPEDGDVLLAPLVASPEALEPVRMDQLDAGPVDYVVKCTEGLFSGRFIYVNRTPQGELFGSDKGSKEVTMYIENASLSPKHAEIKFNSQTYQYFLCDAGSAEGTWLRIRWNRSVEVAPGQELNIGDSILDIERGPEIVGAQEVEHWLAAYQLQQWAPLFHASGVTTLAAIPLHEEELRSGMSGTDRDIFDAAIGEMEKMWPQPGYPAHSLVFRLRNPQQPSTFVASIAWEGGTIALAPSGEEEEDEFEDDDAEHARARQPKDRTVGVAQVAGWKRCEWLRVGYSFGKFYVHLSERCSESSQKGWVRLRPDQSHWLQPNDLFRIGTLQFQVLRFNTAVYSEQGFRATMEDEDILLQDLAASNWRHCSFFGVYDGHGGRDCVSFVRQRLHVNVFTALHAKGGLDKSACVHHDMLDSLRQGFRETDKQFLERSQVPGGNVNGASGSAAVVACIVGGWIWCANLGDSRALLCRDGRAIQLSLDHKPDREDEAERIQAAGGFVSFRRVLGRLAVSRAFGDVEYKAVPDRPGGQSLVIAEPEIRLEQLTPQDEFLFMACDGLFDVFGSQEAVDFIHARLAAMPQNEQDPQRVVQDIVHEAIHDRRSRDNVTAMLVTFKRAVTRR